MSEADLLEITRLEVKLLRGILSDTREVAKLESCNMVVNHITRALLMLDNQILKGVK